MHSQVFGLRVAGTIFGLMCLGQLTRLLTRLDVTAAGWHVPLWLSAIAVVVLALLCFWLWRLSLPAKPAGGAPPA